MLLLTRTVVDAIIYSSLAGNVIYSRDYYALCSLTRSHPRQATQVGQCTVT